MKKILFGGIIIVVAGLGIWYLAGSEDDSDAASAELTQTGVATRGDLTVSISAVGTVEPIQAVEIKSKASGEIIELTANEGDYVEKGELLVRLDPTTVQNTYDQAKADFEVAKITLEQQKKELKRQKDLFDQGLISELAYDDARLAYEQANSQYVRAQASLSTSAEALEDTEIRAPINGLVLTRSVEEGMIISSGTSSVTGGTLLYLLANMSQVYVVADVDETDIGRVKLDLPARVEADAYPDQTFDGEVLRIAPLAKVEQNVTMFEVTILVDNEDGLLKAGMNADVEMVIDESLNTTLVPVKAVQMRIPEEMRQRMAAMRNGGSPAHPPEDRETPSDAEKGNKRPQRSGPRMYVQVIEDGKIVEKDVTIGLTNLDYAEITEGIEPGDSLQWSLTSNALQQREAFRQRMLRRTSMPGMRGR